MVDKSWGAGPSAPVTTTSGFRVRSNDTLSERAAARAKAREDRLRERDAVMAQRLEARAADREADTAARERARVERREAEIAAAAAAAHAPDPHAAAANRHRGSGRKDVVREQRDTRAYTTIVDGGRMRELARRGASVSGLAGAFAVSEEEVRRILEAADDTADA